MLVTFEGIDGSGKSTQLELLAKALSQQGFDVLQTREPGGASLGKSLREILLHHPGYVSPRCELFLYLADRAQHVDEIIRPALAKGQIVLSDRFMDSTVAYQGGGRELTVSDMQDLNRVATQNLSPQLTLFYDAPVETLLSRAQKRGEADRLEQETVVFYERVRAVYLQLAQAEPERFVILDALQSIDHLAEQTVNTVANKIKEAQSKAN